MPVIVEAPADKLRRLAELRKTAAKVHAERDDTFERLGYVPTPRQRLFHDAEEYDVFYGGAAGGGKTKALLMEGLRACGRYPGIRVGAFRRSFPELEESFIAELGKVSFAKALGARWRDSKHDLVFDNGSLLMFRYAKNLQEATVRQGAEYQLVLIDERTLIPPEVPTYLSSRIRTGSPSIPVLGMRSGANPGGPGHADMKARYIQRTNYGAEVYEDDRGRLVRFIPAKIDDNPHLNPEYTADLEALPAAMRKAFRDGDWDSFIGQVFEEWRHDRHVVPRFAVPSEWRRVAGVDWGYAAPWCVLWVAVDPDGRLWLYRERYETKVGETEQARRILADEGEERPLRLADPSMWKTTGEGLPIADTYAVNGCALAPANNERLAGWQRVHHYLADMPGCRYHRSLGWDRCPRLHILDGTAPNLVRTLPALPYDRKHPEDVDTEAEDHAGDALRYLVMGIGGGQSVVDWDDTPPETGLDGSTLHLDMGPFAIDPQNTYEAAVTKVDEQPGEDDYLY